MELKEKTTLIFVYNTNSGTLNTVFDVVHKVISPKTYKCNLYAITYGLTGMKKKWKKYIKELDLPVKFLHKNEFKKKYSVKNAKFPAAFLNHENKIKQILSPAEINKGKTLQDLQSLINSKL